MRNLHKKIRAIRYRRGLTRTEVADDALLSLKTFQRIEQGAKDPTEGETERIAAALGCSSAELRHFDLSIKQGLHGQSQPTYNELLARNKHPEHLLHRVFDVTFSILKSRRDKKSPK